MLLIVQSATKQPESDSVQDIRVLAYAFMSGFVGNDDPQH